jgi:glycerol-3-phosphate O-acyltransferase
VSHATVPPPGEVPTEPPGRPRSGLLGRWFEPVKVARDATATLADLASRGSLVFVMRAPGLLNYLYVKWFLRQSGLPPLRAAQGFPGFFGWLSRVGRTRRALEEAVGHGGASLVFLGRRPPARDPFAALVRQQRDLFQPVLLVPVLLVWSRRPPKLEGSIWDVLYGSPDAPSLFANAVAFLRNFRRAFFEVGRPIDLQAFVAERPEEADAAIARKVRGALYHHLSREFRTAVGPPLKGPSRVQEKVLRDRTLRATMEAVARETGRTPAAITAEAARALKQIASRYDPLFIRMMRPVMAWLLGRLFKSVEVDEAGLARLKRAAVDAPLVLCPSHKSYIDFCVLPWLMYEHGMTPPHVAAGQNLAFWPFGGIARRGGAFFIKRRMKGDRIYTAVLRAYVKLLLRDRYPQEFYVEGGRSRTGKLLFPKTGLVSMEVDAWLDGAADDVLFVPIAIDYERLIEAGTYVRELEGGEKQKENLRGLLRAVRVLFRRHERMYVQFEEPISLRELAQARLGDRTASLTIDDTWTGEATRSSTAIALPGPAGAGGAVGPEKRRLVQALANRIAYGISRAVTITPVGLVAAALLSHVRRGITAGEVGRRVEFLRSLAARGSARLAPGLAEAPTDPREPGPVRDAMDRLVALLLVRAQVAADETIYQVPDDRRSFLDYHRNAVIHRFVAPSLVATAVRAQGPWRSEAVRARALWLSRLFKLEFMYRVGATFDQIFTENAALLVEAGAVSRSGEDLRPGPDVETLTFLAEITRAYLEAYKVTVSTVLSLSRRLPLDRRTIVREALERGRASFLAGEVVLRESLSKAPISNALEWMVDQGLLLELDGGRLRLAERSGSSLHVLVEEISRHLI